MLGARSAVMQVGLGTDVAGGYSPSMLNAMRSCVIASRALCMQHYAALSKATEHDPSSQQGEHAEHRPSSQQSAALTKAPNQALSSHQDEHAGCKPDFQQPAPSPAQQVIDNTVLEIPAVVSRRALQAADLLDWRAAFWLATVGGAQALGIEQVCGTLETGKAFDALRVDTRNAAAFDVFPADTPMDAFQKFINLGDDRNIKAVWVGGKLVCDNASLQ